MQKNNEGDHYRLDKDIHAFRAVCCSGASCGTLSFQTMTKEERIKADLEKLYRYRADAMSRGDIVWLSRNNDKIKEKEKELEDAKKYRSVRLLDILADKGDDVKNRVYKALIKISLAADFVNDCTEEAKSLLKELDLNDFTLRAEAKELCKLSQKIASFVIFPGQCLLSDMMLEDSEFIDSCHAAADEHLKKTLKL